MNLMSYVKKAETLITSNSPLILTAVGVAGTVATAVLTAKATVKAVDKLNYHSPTLNTHKTDIVAGGSIDDGPVYQRQLLTKREKFDLIWKLYIPAAGVGVLTCASIIGAHRIGAARTAAVATALALTERTLDELRHAVANQLSATAHEKLQADVVTARVEDKVEAASLNVDLKPGQILVEEAYTNRYFACSEMELRAAESDVLRIIGESGSISMEAFYKMVGLDSTSMSMEFGWNESTSFKLVYTPFRLASGVLGISFDYAERPVMRPWTAASF